MTEGAGTGNDANNERENQSQNVERHSPHGEESLVDSQYEDPRQPFAEELNVGKQSQEDGMIDHLSENNPSINRYVVRRNTPPSTQSPGKGVAAAFLGRIIVLTFSASVFLSFGFAYLSAFRPTTCTLIEKEGRPVEQCVTDLEPAFELFKTTSSIMAGPLGFVLGFYFREASGG